MSPEVFDGEEHIRPKLSRIATIGLTQNVLRIQQLTAFTKWTICPTWPELENAVLEHAEH